MTDQLMWMLPVGLGLLGMVLAFVVWNQRLQREIAERKAAEVRSKLVTEQVAQRDQLNTQISAILINLQRVDSYDDLSRTVFNGVAPLLDLGQASLYRTDPEAQRLALAGAYARSGTVEPGATVDYGSGLLGQCAVEKRALFLRNPPADYLTIRSGLGSTLPQAIMLLPILSTTALLGVIELALLRPLRNEDQELMDRLLPMVAMSMEIIARNDSTQDLLKATQDQAAALESQRQEISRNRQFMEAVLENINSAVYVKDRQGIYTFVNGDWERATGLRREDVLGRSTLELNHGGRGQEYFEADMDVLRRGEVQTVEETVEAEGTTRYYQTVKVPMRQGGVVTGLCNIAFEITERKQLERSMRDSEARLRQILENSPIGVSINTEAGVPVFSNQRVRELLKIPADQAGQRSSKEFWLRQSDREAFFAQVHRDGAVLDYKADFACADGVPLTVLLSSMFMELTEGRTLVTWIYDISEREKAENAVRQANAEQTAIFETATVGIALTKDRLFVRCNPYIERAFGWGPGELVGKSTRVLFPDDASYARVGQGMMAAFGRGETYRYEVEYMRKDGSRFWGRVHGSMVDPKDLSRGVVLMGEDASEERAAAAALERARDIAEDATKAKSDFLANMSHEIRTPMNAIIGMSHLALQTNLDKKQRNYIEKVHRSGENLLGIINDILDFSKIEAGKMSMETIDFRLEDVMDNLAHLVGMKAEDKGLELLFNASADVPTALTGDPLRLGQILINLGNNAVKFTDSGEIVVGIEKVTEDTNGVELHFWVKDSGIGMTPEQCSKMFQSFSQADASTTRKYGGTGLGLAISKNLVEAMQGRIWVESEAGKGSSFHFHARFGLQADPMPRRMFRAEELLGVRALVVDDNASAREILSTMAKTFGLEVDVAWDGTQALRMIAESDKKALPYDMVLMDWKMPVMDGVETVRQLQEERLSRVPTVIMVTAYGREEAMGSAQERGVKLNAVLTKPVTSSTLLEAIGETLGKGIIAETRATEKAGTHTEVMAQLKGARVLLVEDNDMNQELAMELLANAGIDVILANHGKEAVDILAQDSNFDGVLMDCQMPVMDGYAATRQIRRDPAFKDLPIIAMTANAMAGDREKVLEAGMWDHIAKPLNVGEMFATIAKWIKPKGVVATKSVAAHTRATGATGIKDTDVDSAPSRVHAQEITVALERLTALLKDSDADASDAVDALLELARGTPLASTLERVVAMVADFDFDAALAALTDAG